MSDRPRDAETLLRHAAALAAIRYMAATADPPAEKVARMRRIADAALGSAAPPREKKD